MLNMKEGARIAIVGGGPGGLILARILQMRGITAMVFERERDPNERPQGGTLDLHPDSGQVAVQLAGLHEQFRAIARYEDQGMQRLNKAGQILFEVKAEEGSGDRPETDRTELRKMLLDALEPDVVRWGCNVRAIRQRNDGTYELTFEDATVKPFDLVVGADGAWSRVRPLVSDAIPVYTGVTFIEFGLDDVDDRHAEVARLVGHGSIFALADSKGLIAQRNGHGHIRVYAGMRIEQGWEVTAGFDAGDPQRARVWLLAQFAGWDQSLLALIEESDDRFVSRPLFMLPVGHRWDFRTGVTLLGDAAHLMSPFSGEGVNLAMTDAADLACAISECDTLDEAVRRYEQKMFARAEIAARGANEGLNKAFAPDSEGHMPPAFSAVISQG